MSVNRASTEHKQSVNNFGCYIYYKPRAKLRLLSIIEVLATSRGNVVNIVVNTRKNERQQSIKTVSTERQQSVNRGSTECQQSLNRVSTEHQQSINDFGCYILYNPRVVLLRLPIIKVLAAFRGDMVTLHVTTPENERQQSINRASTERQQSWVLHLV